MSTMFLHSLLVLLVPIHMTLACPCDGITLLKAMCTSTTVVQARVSNGQPLLVEAVPYKRYKIDDLRILRAQEEKLSLLNGYGSLLFPERVSDCGGILTDGLDYVIAGYVDSNGELVSSRCYHYVPYEYLITDPHAMRILINEGDCNDDV